LFRAGDRHRVAVFGDLILSVADDLAVLGGDRLERARAAPLGLERVAVFGGSRFAVDLNLRLAALAFARLVDVAMAKRYSIVGDGELDHGALKLVRRVPSGSFDVGDPATGEGTRLHAASRLGF